MPLSLGTEFALLAFRRSEARPMARSFSRRSLALFSMVFLTAVFSAAADWQHDDLSEQQLGSVHFPTSCNPKVQKNFERGVALLHSFAFETAEATFRQIAQDDPHCAMAHWGIARSFWRWSEPDASIRQQGRSQIKLAESLHPRTKREKEYIAATTALYKDPDKKNEKRWDKYLRGMEHLHQDFPNDHEATAFYAFALIAADDDNDPQHIKRRQAAALLEPLFTA